MRHDLDQGRASRCGLALFGFYVLAYGGFMAVAVCRPDLMAKKIGNGVNLAIHWGFALIGLAVLLSAIYLFAKGKDE